MTDLAYPMSPGAKSDGASTIAAELIDPNRKLAAQVAILVRVLLGDTDLVPDELAFEIREPILFSRPRVSELVNLGLVLKGPTKLGSSHHSRPAHTIHPSEDLIRYVYERDPETPSDLRGILRGLIVTREIEDRRIKRQNRKGGVHA